MKLSPFLLPCILGATFAFSSLSNAQTDNAQPISLNMVAYEHKAPNQYATVLYMPYYPAYGMISLKSPGCSAEIAGYINPFTLKDKKLIINYKTCKISFDISQNNQELSNPQENEACQTYHPKNCNFSQMPLLRQISLGKRP